MARHRLAGAVTSGSEQSGSEQSGSGPRRLFCEEIGEPSTDANLDEVAQQHRRVLRLRDGDEIELFDGRGRIGRALLKRSTAQVLSVRVADEPTPRLGLVIGTPKAKVADDVVRFATELGAADIVFVSTERTIARPSGKKDKRLERWRRIARESCRQSERAFVPRLRMEQDLDAAIRAIPDAANRYVCHARGTEDTPVTGDERWVVIGPEGGLSGSELEALLASGFAPLSLGRHILRVDTAACAAMTLLAR